MIDCLERLVLRAINMASLCISKTTHIHKKVRLKLFFRRDLKVLQELRFQNIMIKESNEGRKVNLDLLDEVREQARIKVEALKRRVELKQESNLRPRQFGVADLLMRKVHPYQLENKLSPKWTGPFRVVEELENGTYKLETLEGGAIPWTWNAVNIKFYFN